MDFELTSDQEALTEGVRSMLQGRFDIEAVRALEDVAGAVSRDRWSELAETGVFSIALSEEEGGVGLGMADAVLVFAELGKALVPGPLVGTFLAAGVVEGAATGETVVGVVERTGGPVMIEHQAALDVLCIVDDEGVWSVSASEVVAQQLEMSLDPLTPVARAETLPQGTQLGGAEMAADWRARGTALTSAIQLGLAEGALALSVGYAKERVQFGKPIGSFQAVKHLCAEMLTLVEVARAAVYAAGVTLDVPEVGPLDRALASAKITADHAASFCGKQCTQVHGGMGYTWEVDAHLFTKRAWVGETQFGDTEHWAEVVASTL